METTFLLQTPAGRQEGCQCEGVIILLSYHRQFSVFLPSSRTDASSGLALDWRAHLESEQVSRAAHGMAASWHIFKEARLGGVHMFARSSVRDWETAFVRVKIDHEPRSSGNEC